jgi:hypothetical protein
MRIKAILLVAIIAFIYFNRFSSMHSNACMIMRLHKQEQVWATLPTKTPVGMIMAMTPMGT